MRLSSTYLHQWARFFEQYLRRVFKGFAIYRVSYDAMVTTWTSLYNVLSCRIHGYSTLAKHILLQFFNW